MMIVQVVPTLYPVIDGLGDYALNLARQLRQDFGIETHFIVGDPTWPKVTQIEGFTISQVTMHSATHLLSLLPKSLYATTVLVHYVNYGYAKRGCPFWLVNGLEGWRTLKGNRLLVTMFHELYAFGSPWASSFWLSPWQKSLAVRLATLSDRTLTNRQGYAQDLHQLSRGKHTAIPTLPVFSNIGEPKQVPPLTERTRRLVIFGTRPSRLRVYQQCILALAQTSQELAIEEICDVGQPTGLDISQVNGVPLIVMGELSATEISTLLLNSTAGFFNYSIEMLAKSGIFAAYCAHGLIPIVSTRSHTLWMDGLEAGKHCWLAMTTGKLSLATGQAIADNAYAWYQTHNLSAQAKIFAAYLSDEVTNT